MESPAEPHARAPFVRDESTAAKSSNIAAIDVRRIGWRNGSPRRDWRASDIARCVHCRRCAVSGTWARRLNICCDAEHLRNFVASEHERQPDRRLAPLDAVEPRQLDTRHLLAYEEQRTTGLILRRHGRPPDDRERGEEGLGLSSPQVGGVTLALEKDEASNPVAIRLFGAHAAVPQPYHFPYPIRQHRSPF
jgi:hypothetical protein